MKKLEDKSPEEIRNDVVQYDLGELYLNSIEHSRLLARTVRALVLSSKTGMLFHDAYKAVLIEEKEKLVEFLEWCIKRENNYEPIMAKNEGDLRTVKAALREIKRKPASHLADELVKEQVEATIKQYIDISSRFPMSPGNSYFFAIEEKEGRVKVRHLLAH